jgi:phosphopantothenoylcysteine decarboxylase/phosphopantothenate--cysteine ligase
VGFAAEHGEGAVAYGRGKLERKRLDAIVVNDISQPGIGFDADDNEVTILLADGSERPLRRSRK